MSWIDDKEAMLREFNSWLTGYTNQEPRPTRLIDLLLDIKPYLEMANEEEFRELAAWWGGFKERNSSDE